MSVPDKQQSEALEGGVTNPTSGPTPLSHIEDPAVVLNVISLCDPAAPLVLAAFEKEVYGDPRSPGQFRVAFVDSDAFGVVAVVVFPRAGVDRLADICAENGLVLVRGILTAINAETKERRAFDVETAIAGLTCTLPADGEVYTFGERLDPAVPRIICGVHDQDLPDVLKTPTVGASLRGAG